MSHQNATEPSKATRSRFRSRGRTAQTWLSAYGVNPRRSGSALGATPQFWSEYRQFKAATDPGETLRILPALHEKSSQAGDTQGHYFWQDLLVARRVFELNPARHVDIGSRVDGFISHLLVFRSVEVIDIRAIDSPVDGLVFRRGDAMSLDTIDDQSCESISSLHAIEHFGLGRYGDPIDPRGHIKGMQALQRVVAPGGRAWVSMPIGPAAVEFNSQRIVDPVLIPETMSELTLTSFTAIPPFGTPETNRQPEDFRNTDGWCGLYEFTRG